jgi:hypothetical protein
LYIHFPKCEGNETLSAPSSMPSQKEELSISDKVKLIKDSETLPRPYLKSFI